MFHDFVLVWTGPSQSRSQSLPFPLDQRSENESSGSNHFEITEFWWFCPSSFTAQSASMAHAWNGCSQSSRFPTAGQGERRLWERDWVCPTVLRPGMRTSSIFNTQHVATWWPNSRNMLHPTMLGYVAFKCCDRLAGAFKRWANNFGICQCVEMLRSFGRGFNLSLLPLNIYIY